MHKSCVNLNTAYKEFNHKRNAVALDALAIISGPIIKDSHAVTVVLVCKILFTTWKVSGSGESTHISEPISYIDSDDKLLLMPGIFLDDHSS